MNVLSIIIFITMVLVISYYSYRKTSATVDVNSSEGFFMGGRTMTTLPLAGTIIMANISTEQIIGQNGQSYVAGMEVMAWEVTSGIAIIALALVFLPRYMKYGIDTIPDFFELRYDTTTKRIMSALFIFHYAFAFLPVILYSGALVFNNVFGVEEMLGTNSLVAIIVIIWLIGLVSIGVLLAGGMSLVNYSNSIYGVGLLILGFLVPILGLRYLGGSVVGGLEHIVNNTPFLLNSVGAVDSNYVPWPTLFTGMLFNNLYFWCTNQMIVQKTFTARSLADAQKGTLLVGVFKVVAAFILVFPGVISRNIFGDALMSNADAAYPALLDTVLPNILTGVMAAVIFGAILSTFLAGLIATSTLFSLDFYKPMINKDADSQQVAKVGKIVVIVLGIVAMVVAPFIINAPAGLYHFTQEFYGIYSMSLLVLVLGAFFYKKGTALAAKSTMVAHFVLYALAFFLLPNIHYLYILSVLFFVDILIYVLVSKWKPEGDFEMSSFTTKVDVTPWKYANVAGVVLVILIVGTYVLFSPIGLQAIL